MRQYQTGEGLKLPEIASPVKAKDILETSIKPQGEPKKLYIPTMKIYSEDSPTSAHGETELPQLSQSDKPLVSKFGDEYKKEQLKEQNPKSLQSHFNYEHFTGDTKRNVPSQPELIRLLSETELDPRKGLEKDKHKANASDQAKAKKEICGHCRMTDGKHKHWCIVYLEHQKAKDTVIFADRTLVKRNKKKVSFGDAGYDSNDSKEAGDKTKIPPILKTPQLIRSRTTLDGLNRATDHHDFSSLHREVYIQALAEARARHMSKLKCAYNFSTQSTKPFLFSYFDSILGPSNRLKNNFDGMKHIFGKVKIDKYYERLAGKNKKESNAKH